MKTRTTSSTRVPQTMNPDPSTARTVSEIEVAWERIELRAFEIYQDRVRKGEAGDAMSDWVQAEQELASERFPSTPSRPLKTQDSSLRAKR